MRAGPGDETPAQRRRRREEEERRRRQEEARRRQEQREDASDAVEGAADVVEAGSGLGVPTGLGRGRTSGGRSDGGSGGWGCDGWGSRGSGVSGPSGGARGGGSGWGCGGGSGGRSGGGACDNCDGCDCNLSLLAITRLSTLLLLAAAVLPDRGGSAVARGLIRLYRRRLTRFTPRCPSTPSCSTFALAAVQERGARRGLVAAARRVRSCGTPSVRRGRAAQ